MAKRKGKRKGLTWIQRAHPKAILKQSLSNAATAQKAYRQVLKALGVK